MHFACRKVQGKTDKDQIKDKQTKVMVDG